MKEYSLVDQITPADVAFQAANKMTNTQFEITHADEDTLVRLDAEAEKLGLHDNLYFVGANRGLSIPVMFEPDEDVEHDSYRRIIFEGKFVTFSKVVIGRIIGGWSVRAFCLTFDEVTLFQSSSDSLPEDCLFHVPVLAVESMQRAS